VRSCEVPGVVARIANNTTVSINKMTFLPLITKTGEWDSHTENYLGGVARGEGSFDIESHYDPDTQREARSGSYPY